MPPHPVKRPRAERPVDRPHGSGLWVGQSSPTPGSPPGGPPNPLTSLVEVRRHRRRRAMSAGLEEGRPRSKDHRHRQQAARQGDQDLPPSTTIRRPPPADPPGAPRGPRSSAFSFHRGARHELPAAPSRATVPQRPLPMASLPGSPREITGTATSSAAVLPPDPAAWSGAFFWDADWACLWDSMPSMGSAGGCFSGASCPVPLRSGCLFGRGAGSPRAPGRRVRRGRNDRGPASAKRFCARTPSSSPHPE